MKALTVVLCVFALGWPVSNVSAQKPDQAAGLPDIDAPIGDRRAPENAGPPLTLDEVERMALARNPEIAVAVRRVVMAEAIVPAAGALDDPEFMYRGWGVPLSQPWNYNAAQNMFMFTQLLDRQS